MTGGVAFIAWPAVFGSTGIMTFIVGPDGDVHQKDLGAETEHVAGQSRHSIRTSHGHVST